MRIKRLSLIHISKQEPFGFCYGKGVFGPEAEIRRLDDIRASLEDPGCTGPEAVYSISMDVGMEEDREEIEKRNLLYGAVTYAAGTLGREPVRSQGHIHAVSISCGSSTPEAVSYTHLKFGPLRGALAL